MTEDVSAYLKMPLEEVTWEDHFSTTDWTTKDDESLDLKHGIFVTTIGYRLKESKLKVVLVQNVATNGALSGTMTILKKTVKSRTVIREAKEI